MPQNKKKMWLLYTNMIYSIVQSCYCSMNYSVMKSFEFTSACFKRKTHYELMCTKEILYNTVQWKMYENIRK